MKDITINVDLDGVVYNFHREIQKKLVEKLGYSADITRWEIWEDYGISQSYFQALFRQAVDEGVFLEGKPIVGAPDGLWRLHEEGFKVRLITRRLVHFGLHAKVVTHTAQWLDQYAIPYWTLCFVGKSDDKTGFAANLALDDSYKHWKEMKPYVTFPYLFRQPWNARYTDAPQVTTWTEFVDICLRYRKNHALSVALESARQ